jgi:hypothetical protein
LNLSRRANRLLTPGEQTLSLAGRLLRLRSKLEVDVVQLRILADIVGFDLTHVYLMLDVLGKGEPDEQERSASGSQRNAVLRLTLPECHVFLRALREFHGLIEVTTPVLEEAKKLKTVPGDSLPSDNGAPVESSLDTIIERLNARAAEREQARTGT